jgi:hypothetical protein
MRFFLTGNVDVGWCWSGYQKEQCRTGYLLIQNLKQPNMLTEPSSLRDEGDVSQTWHFLNQEAFLIASCLGNGLTAIRRAPIKGEGEWYSAFFQLSIGLERLMKAIIIVDLINRGELAALTNDVLKKKYGHDLLTLLESVSQINVATKPNPASAISKASTGYRIFAFLNNFAKQARYHNIDSLTGAVASGDPLADWDKILGTIITEDLPEKKRKRIIADSNLVATLIGHISIVIDYGLDKSPLTTEQYFQQPALHDAAAGYVVCHVLDIARPLESVLSDLTHASYSVLIGGPDQVPDMWEHLVFLRETRCSEIRRRKLWP